MQILGLYLISLYRGLNMMNTSTQITNHELTCFSTLQCREIDHDDGFQQPHEFIINLLLMLLQILICRPLSPSLFVLIPSVRVCLLSEISHQISMCIRFNHGLENIVAAFVVVPLSLETKISSQISSYQ